MREDLTIGGAILLIAGVFLSFVPWICFVGPVLVIAGLILLFVGLVLSEDKPPHVVYAPQYPPPYPQQYPPQYQAQPPPPVQPQPQQPPAKPFCSNCGGRVNPNEKFCSHCGSQIP